MSEHINDCSLKNEKLSLLCLGNPTLGTSVTNQHRDEATSSELRHDWLADRWVIIAPQRSERPQDFERRSVATIDGKNCPFCVGNEEETPSAVAIYHPKHRTAAADWHVRVVPNKFPAVRLSSRLLDNAEQLVSKRLVERPFATPMSGAHATADAVNLFMRRDLTGGHEVIVESPKHIQSISQLDRESTSLVFRAYRDRLAYWLNDCQQAYAVVFKNVGQDAGASLFHTHSQLIATDILPTDVERATQRMRLFAEKESECLFCRMKNDEIEQGSRVVEETRDFVAFCPFASRIPSLITVVPKRHQSSFESLPNQQLDELSWLSHRLIRRIEKCFPETAYNFVIHTAPRIQTTVAQDIPDIFHWRMELFPRVTTAAGFEWGSDCYINPLAPEAAADALRKAGV